MILGGIVLCEYCSKRNAYASFVAGFICLSELAGIDENAACKILMFGSVRVICDEDIFCETPRRVHREMHQKGRFFQANKSSSRMKVSFSHSLDGAHICTMKRCYPFHAREISRKTRAWQSEMRCEEEK